MLEEDANPPEKFQVDRKWITNHQGSHRFAAESVSQEGADLRQAVGDASENTKDLSAVESLKVGVKRCVITVRAALEAY